jgi:hypothetical protein
MKPPIPLPRAATQDLSHNVRAAATGSQDVSARIASTSRSVGQAGSAATAVLDAADAVAGQSRALKDQLVQIVDQVRAA